MRFWILQVMAVALFIAGWIQGSVASVYENDQTRLTVVISVIFLAGVWFAARSRHKQVEYVATILPTLGLLGTVIGFSIALSGAEGQEYALRDLGVYTALNTTIVGLVGSLWLGLMRALE